MFRVARIGSCGLVAWYCSLRSRLPDVRTGEALHWCRAAKTDCSLSHRRWGGVSPGFHLLRQGQVYRPAPKSLLFRGMPTSLKIFLEPVAHLSFGSCPVPHIKRPCATFQHGGMLDKYQQDLWMPPVEYWWFVQCILCSKIYFLIKLIVLYSHMQIHIYMYTCIYMQNNHNDTRIKDERSLL